MFALFDEAGKFLAGKILSETDSSAQVELDSGKRLKVKSANQLLRFEKPAPAALIADASALAAEIELPLAWEFAPEEEFGFAELASEYFGNTPGVIQQAAMLMALQEAPHYFRRAGKGRFRRAPAEIVAQALAAIEKKKQIAAQITAWAAELGEGSCPAPIREQLYKILFKPDKNAPEYKAVVEASRATRAAPLALLQKAGAIESAYQFHWQRFLFDNFPKGTGFAPLAAPVITEELPLATVQAYSIDDSQTTEIDDALSLQGLGSGTVILGIHIAAPALAIQPGDPLDDVSRSRLSTVYMPGYKITMLPDDVVQTYTLSEGRAAPAVSLYVTLDEATLEIKSSETRLERVPIAANLRHDQLDHLITAEWLAQTDAPNDAESASLPIKREALSFLYALAKHLKARREVVRGKPETFNRPDYNFRLIGNDGEIPKGNETVQITTRQRGAPLDLMVAEMMILANSTWGQWLASLGVPAIYRNQASMAPGVKVRMGTKALPHAGIGVPSYAWSTSPLRRYVDLANQWQIIAAARHGQTAALVAPFKPKDAQLFAIISAFDAAYSAYNAHQSSMERFWTLHYLRQQGITELTASLLREQGGGAWLARADELPLVFTVMGAQGLPRGTSVRVKLGDIDDIALDVGGTVLEVLTDSSAEASDANNEAEDEDDDAAAGPIAIAVDVNEAEASNDNSTP
ncbi:ribonuclease catalytic domain-containing protein [Ottowia thiooxydans]|uniref:ribonuclease catalytic domain-containing protein n=1 Tax=Ottowia thiooxydans TaxID=219182 RepID=UPI00041D90C8|nr:ribonuclease catalytic domain-containing protein [Ottowia thiooxydans]